MRNLKKEMIDKAKVRAANNINKGILKDRDECIGWLKGYLDFLGYIPIELIDFCEIELMKKREESKNAE